jgi:hypothetical protein
MFVRFITYPDPWSISSPGEDMNISYKANAKTKANAIFPVSSIPNLRRHRRRRCVGYFSWKVVASEWRRIRPYVFSALSRSFSLFLFHASVCIVFESCSFYTTYILRYVGFTLDSRWVFQVLCASPVQPSPAHLYRCRCRSRCRSRFTLDVSFTCPLAMSGREMKILK